MVVLRLTKTKMMKDKMPSYQMTAEIVFNRMSPGDQMKAARAVSFVSGLMNTDYDTLESRTVTTYQMHIPTYVNNYWRLFHNEIIRNYLVNKLGVQIFNYYDTISYADKEDVGKVDVDVENVS